MNNPIKTNFLVLLSMIICFTGFGGTIEPVKISNGTVTVVVDLEVGGRIIEYSNEGNNVVFIKDENSSYNGPDGGRCDFGPEKLVPPRPETWLGSWELLEKTDNYIKIRSQVAKSAGVQLIREFTLDDNSSHLKFTQEIHNISDSPKRYCHWSRTFGETNGICLAPLNPNSRFPKGYMVYAPGNMLAISPKGGENERVRDGVLELLGPPENPKFVTDDNAGWLAYITRDNQLFIKKFEVFEDKKYGEMTAATVSLWYNEEGICEIEPIGPWEWIQPDKNISFTENWYLLDYNYPEDKMADLNEIKTIIKKL